MFDPDDFADQPYVGGLNQAMHFVFGAALLGIFHFLVGFPMMVSVLAAGFGIVLWEADQLKRRGATLMDYAYDLTYWLSGVGAWALVIHWGWITGLAEIFPVVPLFIWLIEFTRLSIKNDTG